MSSITNRRLLLIGEAPIAMGEPAFPLSAASTRRLSEIVGVPAIQMVELYEFQNLLAVVQPRGPKGRTFARTKALFELRRARDTGRWSGRNVVFLGERLARVTRAVFPRLPSPLAHWGDWEGGLMAWLSHPSPVNLFYNDESNRLQARLFLEAAIELRGVNVQP